MRAGRSRWKVENETFNTLKNLGYNLEHNYGHGKQHLATVLNTYHFLKDACFALETRKMTVITL